MPLSFTSMKTWVFLFIVMREFMEGAQPNFILPTAWGYIKSLGQTKSFLGIVLSASDISSIFAAPIVGRLSDRFGHVKLIFFVCFFLKVTGYLIYSIPVSAYFPLIGQFIAGVADGSYGVYFAQLALYTEDAYRARVFVLMDGLYILGAAVGPAVSGFFVFNVNIWGWKIDAGNCPGVILTLIWLTFFVISLWLPGELGNCADKTLDRKLLVIDEQDEETTDKQVFGHTQVQRSFGAVLCVFYLIFLAEFISATVTFYIPLLAEQHFHLQLIHVKWLFVVGALFSFVLFLSLYIAAEEHFDERKILAFLILLQTVPLTILGYYAFNWQSVFWNDSYLLIVFICFGMPSFVISFGCSVVSKITDPEDSAFYQGSSFSTYDLACIAGRTISGFVFTQKSLLVFSVVLVIFWATGVIWFCKEYHNLVGRDVS